MTTWPEWFADLDSRLEKVIGWQLPEIDELDEIIRDGIIRRDGIIQKTARLVADAAESHFLAASLLYSQGRKAAWLPAAMPNSEESRLVRRAVTASRRSSLLAPRRSPT